jgi:hypothetical protein
MIYTQDYDSNDAYYGWSETFAPSPEGPSRIAFCEAILSTKRRYPFQSNLVRAFVILAANQLMFLPICLLAFTALQTNQMKSERDT